MVRKALQKAMRKKEAVRRLKRIKAIKLSIPKIIINDKNHLIQRGEAISSGKKNKDSRKKPRDNIIAPKTAILGPNGEIINTPNESERAGENIRTAFIDGFSILPGTMWHGTMSQVIGDINKREFNEPIRDKLQTPVLARLKVHYVERSKKTKDNPAVWAIHHLHILPEGKESMELTEGEHLPRFAIGNQGEAVIGNTTDPKTKTKFLRRQLLSPVVRLHNYKFTRHGPTIEGKGYVHLDATRKELEDALIDAFPQSPTPPRKATPRFKIKEHS